LSLFCHAVVVVGVPLIIGVFYKTRRFERPQTFQLVMAPQGPADETPAAPVTAHAQNKPPPQTSKPAPPPPQPIAYEPFEPSHEPNVDGGMGLPKNRTTNEPGPASNAPSSPAGPPPSAAGGASGQPQRIGSGADLDNVGFEPVISVKPDYPIVALEARITGFVDVDLLIGDDGKVKSFEMVAVKGHPAFGTEAAKVLPRWRFPPPRIKGKKCSVKYVYRINFVLN
jgi:TonB family protein